MKEHHGQIVEHAVRNGGISMSTLSSKMQVSRRTLYNWFKKPVLPAGIIMEIGRIIDYDFASDLPGQADYNFFISGLRQHPQLSAVHFESDVQHWIDKYNNLQDKYNRLLNIKNNLP